MQIRRLSASFGILQNSLKNNRMKLEPGLNIIQSPNEQGKSTWCAFIRAMLYGINTSERKSDGFLPEKAKYQPWTGDGMEGYLELEAEGKAIAIQRTALGSQPMKKLEVRFSGSGEEVLALMHENLGETLTGVPEAVFVRSAFIRQSEMKITQTGQLEQRIAALVSSGEEGVSYRDTVSILGGWLRKRRHNKTGQIPAIEAEIIAINQTLSRMAEASVAYNEVSLEVDRAISRLKALREEQDAHTEVERRNARKTILDAKNKLQDLDLEIAALRKELGQTGKEITREQIADARASYDKLGGVSVRYNEAKAEKESIQRDLELMEEERRHTSFGGRSLEEARELVEQTEKASDEAGEAADFNKQVYTIPMGVLPVVAAGALAAGLVWDLPLWPISIGALLVGALLGVQFYRKWSVARTAEKKRGEAFVRLRVSTMEDLCRELEQYERLSEKAEELQAELQEAEKVSDETREEMHGYKAEFEGAIQSFAPDVKEFAKAFQMLTEIGKVMDRLEVANKERELAAHLFKTLTAQYDGDPQEPIPHDGLQVPRRSKTDTAYELKRTEKELDALKSSYAMAMGEVRALGDPVVLGAKRGHLADRLKDLTRQYEALRLATEVLAEADSEITARFSPLLGQRAGYYLDRLTGGKYKRVLFDKNLTPSAERSGESISRDILYLSGGTVDQIYLALRLAICDLTLPADKACPIILDDALVSFDEVRLEKALVLLKELAERRQVLLFTCHGREAAFFKGDKQVNIISGQ